MGNEALVNTSTFQNQGQQRGTALAGGQYVVVWVDYLLNGQLNATNTANADIKARIFNADGSAAGAEFTVNTVTAAGQIFPNATTLSDGNFIVTWNNGAGTVLGGAGSPIATAAGQEFTAAGTPVGGQFSIGTPGVETTFIGSSALAGGGYVATWQQGGASGNIIAQRYDGSNVAVGAPITVSANANSFLTPVGVRTLTDGNFVVVWNNQPGTGGLSSFQIYTAAGDPVGGRANFGFGAPNGGNFTSMIPLVGGGFAIGTFEVSGGTGTHNVYAFDADGSNQTFISLGTQPIFPAGSSVQNPQGLSLTALANGGASAAWIDNNATNGTEANIVVANFGPSGDQIDQTVIVNTNSNGNQSAPATITLTNGDFVVLWTDASGTLGDASGTSIKQQLFDFSTVNRAPTAVNDVFTASEPDNPFGTDELTFNDIDPDAEALAVTSIFNVTGGTVTLNLLAQEFTIQRAAGSSAPIEFDYTISDLSGATSTAHATLLASRTDTVTIRGINPPIDFLANDFLTPRAQGYGYSLQVLTGNTGPVPPPIIQTPTGPRIGFQSLSVPGYLDLPVGQSIFVAIQYNVFNPVTLAVDYSEVINITLEGWKQTGGTAYDYLLGGTLADHLDGGTGTPNQLQGGLGDDYYTVRVVGDSIVEFADQGFDQVRAVSLPSYVLPNNIEALFVSAPTTGFVGIGNSLNNSISGAAGFADVLVGGGGNDQLRGQSGPANELIGGTGDDTYFVAVAGDTIVEFANEGTDTVSTSLAAYALRDHIENLVYTGAARFTGIGTNADNVITGSTAAAGELIGHGGNDTYVVRNVGDSTIEAVGGGIDTVQTTLSIYTLQANIENLTYTGTTSINAKGNALDNAITGGANNDDYLFAGAGVDTLTGGAGRDVFFFDSAVNGVDIITDFVSGTDRIFLDDAVFTNVGSFVVLNALGTFSDGDGNPSVFLYNRQSGALTYDADGDGAGAAIQIATLSTGLTLAAGDFVFY
jgi:serralysin